jgi:3-hydroxyisobutyrate dehydrogenase-like beta-hydroxyacid dehydrogenase
VLAGAGPGTVVAVHSTVHPRTVHAIAAAAPAGVAVLDAPISGGVQGARSGQLCVMVGGDAAAYARVRPAFDTFGGLVLHLGELGAGLAAKLARNLIGYVTLLAAQEGRRLAVAAGVDLSVLDRILDYTGAVSPMMKNMLATRGGDAVYADDIQALVDLAAKDMRVTLEYAGELGVDLPASALTRDQIAAAFGPSKGSSP